MAYSYTVTLSPIDLLRQVLNFVEAKQPELTVTLQAVEDAFTSTDEPILLMHGASNTHHPTETTSEDPFVLPIRSHINGPSRPSISEQRRQRLRELARRIAGADGEWRQEYVPDAGREGAN
ncbi:hypothetical protein BDW72DRAFT_159451 [Aspergillus terricola var. indicus]